MTNDNNERPLGMINGQYFYQRDIDRCIRFIDKYQKRRQEMLDRADSCTPAQRGGYMSKARAFEKDIERWQWALKSYYAYSDIWDPPDETP